MINTIKKLREQTGLSVADIKNALEEAEGDEKKAMEILRSRGHEIAAKKASRETGEGIVESYIHGNKKVGAIVVLNCETDFVAKNPDFRELAHDLAMQVVSMAPQSADELLGQPFIKDQNITVKQLLANYIAKLGENIKIGEFSRLCI
ncbi:MAG: translation elongation factor Ts [Parcubacteria group bacterium]|nr:translation elongation factor Ts [Parcubacteria group bacterium]